MGLEARVTRPGALANSVTSIAAILFIASLVLLIGFRGTIRIDVGTYVRDMYRHKLFNMPADERQSEYTWKKFNEDIFEQGVSLKPGTLITACPSEIHDHWRMLAYLQRHLRATLTVR